MSDYPVFTPDQRDECLDFYQRHNYAVLAEHQDPARRRYYSQWTTATQAFADSLYADAYYQEHVVEKPT